MKLNALYPKLSVDERKDLAQKAGISPGYLHQIATRWKGKRASLDVIQKLEDADGRLKRKDLVAEFMEAA